MTLSPGRRLGPYEILSPLGAGGMGEVYKARDIRLGRAVAIKVLPIEFASDPDRLRRFEREARAASALNHPNIVTVYDIGTEGSTSYLAMEFVDGRTLQDILLAGPLSLKRLVDLATQIADGIATAHEAGIVHRDLKPGNLMVTKNGLVKVLDFGLARREPLGSEGSGHDGSTVTSPSTMPGSVIGTVGYMSPEQARGEEIDSRSDQFSVGSILYEMATGTRAFQKASSVETLSAILNDEPETIIKRRPEIPPPMRWIIERCLCKSPTERYVATRDLARDLHAIRLHLSELSGVSPGAPEPARNRRSAALWGLGAVLTAAALWYGLALAARHSPMPEFRRLTFRDGLVARALFVPRSNAILYTAAWDREQLGSFLTLPEAKGADRRIDAPVQMPMSYSADGSQVLVLLGSSRPSVNPVGKLAWWPALGGQPRVLLDGVGWSDWASKRHFLAVVRTVGDERLLEIRPEPGTEPRTIFRTAGAISWVRISPDERRVAFFHHRSRFDDSGEVRLAEIDGTSSRPISPVFESCRGLAWNDATGEVWFTATKESAYSTALWAASEKGALRRVYSFPSFLQLQDVSGGQCLLTSESGDVKLLVQRAREPEKELTWLGSSMITDLSPDGKNVLFIDENGDQGSPGTWVRSLQGGEPVKVADGEFGTFSPDGQSIVTTTPAGSSPPQVILVSLGSGATRQITSSNAAHSFPSFLGSDRILFGRVVDGHNEVWQVPVRGGEERRVVAGCEKPTGSPSGARFFCTGGERANVLFVGTIEAAGEPALRRLFELPPPARFVHARWDSRRERIHVITTLRRVLLIDATRGTLLSDDPNSLADSIRPDSILGAALNDDASLQVFSVSHLTSQLYLLRSL